MRLEVISADCGLDLETRKQRKEERHFEKITKIYGERDRKRRQEKRETGQERDGERDINIFIRRERERKKEKESESDGH